MPRFEVLDNNIIPYVWLNRLIIKGIIYIYIGIFHKNVFKIIVQVPKTPFLKRVSRNEPLARIQIASMDPRTRRTIVQL